LVFEDDLLFIRILDGPDDEVPGPLADWEQRNFFANTFMLSSPEKKSPVKDVF
jgi:hypothetical protein